MDAKSLELISSCAVGLLIFQLKTFLESNIFLKKVHYSSHLDDTPCWERYADSSCIL